MITYLKGVLKEFRNVKWPTTKTTIYYTVGVIAVSVIFAVFILLSDTVFLDTVKVLLNK